MCNVTASPDCFYLHYLESLLNELQVCYFTNIQVYKVLSNSNTKKATVPDDIPLFIVKRLAAVLALPITQAINCSFHSGEFPVCLRDAIVKPLPKKDVPVEIGAWRPISIMSVFSKVSERIVHGQIMAHLRTYDFCPLSTTVFKDIYLQRAYLSKV